MSSNARTVSHYQTVLLGSPPFPDPGCICTTPALSWWQCQGYYSWSDCPKLLMTGYLLTYFFQTKNVRWKNEKIQKWKYSWSRNSRRCCPEYQCLSWLSTWTALATRGNTWKIVFFTRTNRGCWAHEEEKMPLPKFSRRIPSSVGDRAPADSSSPCLMHIPLFMCFL